MTAERVLPYWESDIKPRLIKGEKVFIAAHGNSMRALIMELEGLSGEEIGRSLPSVILWRGWQDVVDRELATGVPIVYKLDKSGNYVSKEILDYVHQWQCKIKEDADLYRMLDYGLDQHVPYFDQSRASDLGRLMLNTLRSGKDAWIWRVDISQRSISDESCAIDFLT